LFPLQEFKAASLVARIGSGVWVGSSVGAGSKVDVALGRSVTSKGADRDGVLAAGTTVSAARAEQPVKKMDARMSKSVFFMDPAMVRMIICSGIE
jgi:hypothetical protein